LVDRSDATFHNGNVSDSSRHHHKTVPTRSIRCRPVYIAFFLALKIKCYKKEWLTMTKNGGASKRGGVDVGTLSG